MNMLADFTAATRDLLAVMGDSERVSVVRGASAPVVLNLFVDDAIQDLGQYGRVVASKRVVQAMNADWIFKRADVVTVRGRSAAVEEVLANDSIVNTVVLHG